MLIRYLIVGVCLVTPLVISADHHNVIKAPHGLGQFYEEPTGYRYSLRGADKFITSFTGLEYLSCISDQDDFARRITGSMLRWPEKPMLGGTGPSDFPQAIFRVSKPSDQEVRLTLELHLWFPGDTLDNRQPQKVLAFQYQSQIKMEKAACLEKTTELINGLVDRWMQGYASFNEKLTVSLP